MQVIDLYLYLKCHSSIGVFQKFASKNKLPGFYISGKLVQNGLNKIQSFCLDLKICINKCRRSLHLVVILDYKIKRKFFIQDSPRTVIVQPPNFVAPTNVVVANTNNYIKPGPQKQPLQQYPLQQNPSSHQVPPPQSAMPQQQYPVTHDKEKLVTNEVA